MMVTIFASLSAALALACYGPLRLALAALMLGLALAAGLFLFEIDSPDTGYRMPWLQAATDAAGAAARPGGIG